MSAAGISTERVKAFLEAYAAAFQRQDKISPEVAQARVIWALHGEGDRPLYEFEATYTLAALEGELKIVQVISENEQPNFRGVMRERG